MIYGMMVGDEYFKEWVSICGSRSYWLGWRYRWQARQITLEALERVGREAGRLATNVYAPN